MGLLSGYIPGYNTSIVSIAPIYTASVAAFCRLFAQIASSISPYTIGLLTINVSCRARFRIEKTG